MSEKVLGFKEKEAKVLTEVDTYYQVEEENLVPVISKEEHEKEIAKERYKVLLSIKLLWDRCNEAKYFGDALYERFGKEKEKQDKFNEPVRLSVLES